MALLSGTLPGERRRPGWQEQQAVAARPTGLQEWTHQDPPSSHCAYTNFLTQLETIETEAKRDETDRLVILSVDTLLSVKGLESFSQAVELDRHVLPSPKMIWP